MGVYRRPDSPYWWLWLETGSQRMRTAILIGDDKKASRAAALEIYHAEMLQRGQTKHGLHVEKPAITFQKHADWYEVTISRHKRGKEREADILAQLARTFGPLPLVDVTKAAVQDWMNTRRRTVAASTVNRELDLLKHVLASAVPKYLTESPIVGLRRLRPLPTKTATLTPKDETKLLAEVTVENRAILICALDTLMRLSDITKLKRSDDHGKYLVVGDSKTGQYEVPISKRLRLALDALPKSGDLFFRRQRGSVAQMFERACIRAGIRYGRTKSGITFHGLRHTGASRMVERGADLRTVMEIGGWKSLRQLSRYTHPTDAIRCAAVELVSTPRSRRA